MPPAMSYTPNDKDLRDDALSERNTRMMAHAKAQDYYDGNHKRPLRFGGNMPDLNVIVNLFGMRVDRRRDFLFPDFPIIELDSDDDSDNADEQWLRLAWDANNGAVLAGEMAMAGALDGHVYVRIMPPDRSEFPRLKLVGNAITFWQADDVDIALWHELSWQVGKTYYRQDMLDLDALGMGAGWQIIQYRSDNGLQWSLQSIIDWRYDVPPIINWQHWPRSDKYYGKSEASDLPLNDSLNRVLSQANAILRNHAYPKTVATGVTAAKVQPTAVDSFWAIENDNAKVFNLEMHSDLSAILNMADRLTDHYHAQGRTVVLKGNPADFARLTNLAIGAVFMDASTANETLRRQYGKALSQLTCAMLAMDGRKSDYKPILKWTDALPNNELEQAQIVQVQRNLGLISQESAAAEMGLDWATEQQRMADEDDGRSAMMDKLISTGGSAPLSLNTNPTGNPNDQQ